tara:strand:+ start:275 stop:472 length:198 start_codon:yes stop_codon:yes gene_type:complete
MKYPVIITYVLLSMAAVYFFAKPSFKLVSECCESQYRELPKKNGYAMYCLNCKKWCDLIEIKETK